MINNISEKENKAVDAFHRLYYKMKSQTWNNTYWFGIPILKCPLDLWVYQEIIHEIQPELIVETGTYLGGSALYMASLLDMIGKGKIITIDNDETKSRPKHPRINYLFGSSTDSSKVKEIYHLAKGISPVIVILDSNHHKEHVLLELNSYQNLVTKGSYLIVEDTNLNGNPVAPDFGPGPSEAVKEFLLKNLEFETDYTRESFLITANPGGYLRRKLA